MKIISIGAIAVASLALLSPSAVNAEAGRFVDEVRVGALAHGGGGWSPDKGQGVAINFEALFASPDFLRMIGSPRPHIGASIALDSGGVSQVYAGFEWKAHLARRVFVAGSLGGAIHDGETDAFDPAVDLARLNNTLFLGCRALFRLGADLGYDLNDRISASLHWEHISNAGLCDNNEGLDNVGIRLGLSF